MPTHPVISVVLPTFKRPDLLDQCLASLSQQVSGDLSFEVVVVDDGSNDSTTRLLASWEAKLPALKWEAFAANSGPATARNRAVSMAGAELLLFIDDDILVSPNLIRTHIRHHSAGDPKLGVVGLVRWNPEIPATAFMRWLDTTDLQFAYETWLQPGPVAHPWEAFYTCNLSMHKAAFEEAGGFDERFPYPAFEDIELGYRLEQLGFRLEYRPDAVAWHNRAVDVADFSARMRKVGYSAALLRATHPEVPVNLRVDLGPSPAWHRLAMPALSVAVRWMPMRLLRERYYRASLNEAYRSGTREASATKA